MRQTTFTPEFVEYIPRHLDDGVLYVSILYCTAVHKCACGCGNKVVTPISPADWQLQFDGDGVSLFPSVGNWGFPCNAHYWIRSNQVLWAKAWSSDQIARGRARESRSRTEYFARRTSQPANQRGGARSTSGQKLFLQLMLALRSLIRQTVFTLGNRDPVPATGPGQHDRGLTCPRRADLARHHQSPDLQV
jgi:Family of unknown function (DUF6527)